MPEEHTDTDLATPDFNTKALQIVSEFQAGCITFEETKDQSSELYGTLGLGVKEFTRHLLPQIDTLYEISARQTGPDTSPDEPAAANNTAALPAEEFNPDEPKLDAEGATDSLYEGEVGGGDVDPRSEGGRWLFGTSTKSTLDPYTRKTLQYQKEYRDDLSNARTYIMAHDDAPNLPKSVWTAVLEGGYIDFAKINGAQDAVLVEESSTTLGDFIVSTKDRSPSSPVKAYYEWELCYELFTDAVTLAYPHRAAKLKKYRCLIRQLFNDRSPAENPHVIQYDQNVRYKVASNARLRLTDNEIHKSMYTRFFSASGIRSCLSGPPSGSSTTKRGESSSNKVCRNWNRGTCTRPPGTYKFGHQCADCRGSHPAGSTSCPKTSSGTGGRVPRQRNAIQVSYKNPTRPCLDCFERLPLWAQSKFIVSGDQ